MQVSDVQREFLTLGQVADLFGISKQGIQARAARDADFPRPEEERLFGWMLVYRRETVLAWVAEHRPELLRGR